MVRIEIDHFETKFRAVLGKNAYLRVFRCAIFSRRRISAKAFHTCPGAQEVRVQGLTRNGSARNVAYNREL